MAYEQMSPADREMATSAVEALNRANTIYAFVSNELTRRYQLGPFDLWYADGHIERAPESINVDQVPRG